MTECLHTNITCLNQYELIRKYECNSCGEIMMCSCDKEHGEKYLSHQLQKGCWIENQKRVPVTIGFQNNICPVCRGETPVSAPIKSRPGSTSKFSRYYWREIAFETTRRLHEEPTSLVGDSPFVDEFTDPEKRKYVEKQVIKDLKLLYKDNPKYNYQEITQDEVIKSTNTEVTLVRAKYIPTNEKKAQIESENKLYTVEKYAAKHFRDLGYSVIETESVPFHVIFGIYMWSLIQDPNDPYIRVVKFGNRTDFEQDHISPNIIETYLPSDFGTQGYFNRKNREISEYISNLCNLETLFDQWLNHSNDFRQYLWAYREKDIAIAKQIISILTESDIKLILSYLSRNYWSNFCGWPDLLAFKNDSTLFIEVKSSNDKLSAEQKNWMIGNYKYMKFKSIIFKIGK